MSRLHLSLKERGMKTKENKFRRTMLAIVMLILICYNLPPLPFYVLCLKEDASRPPNTEIIISACNKRLHVTGVPMGEVLYISKTQLNNPYRLDYAYLLDLRTGRRRGVPNDPLLMQTQGEFLNSDLVWLEGYYSSPDTPGYRPDYVLDLNDGQRYELISLNQMPLLEGNKFDSKHYAYFQAAERVFLHHKYNTIIALAPNFREHPEGNVIYYKGSEKNGEALERLLDDLGVKYEKVDLSLQYTDVPSPTRRYTVREDGVYLFGTETPVIKSNMRYSFVGWYHDESGIVFRSPGYFLFHIGAWSSFYYIPKPVIKLRLPSSPQAINTQNTAIAAAMTVAPLTLTALPTATAEPTLTPILPTLTPTQLPYSMITPSAIQVERWKEYEVALAKALFPSSFIPGEFLCEWEILGQSKQELYVWAICMSIFPVGNARPTYESTMANVIHIGPDGTIQRVGVSGGENSNIFDIREVFSPEAQARYFEGLINFDGLKDRLRWRREHPEEPPLIVLLATPQATPQAIP
jgi:hypothetical protein